MKFQIQNKWLLIAYGILLVAIGVTTLVLSITNVGLVDQALSISLAIALFIVGILNIVSSLILNTDKFFTSPLFIGSLCVAFGVVLCIDRSIIGSFIVYLLGVFLLALSLVCLIKAVLFIVYKYKVMWIIAQFIIALIGIGGGIVVLCFREESKVVLYAIIGSIILLLGVLEIILALRIMLKKNGQEDEVVVADEKADEA